MQTKIKNIYKRIKSFIISLLPSHLGKTTREFRFYKEHNGRWYVDLPEWKGGKWNLEMVEGADDLLESLRSWDRNDVTLHVSLEHFDEAEILIKTKEDPFGDGADYEHADTGEELWLCGVTSWYYGTMPERIFYRKTL
jgi:hypothetical protein